MFAVMALGLNNLIFLSDLSAASETYSDTMQTLYGQGFAVQILVLGILMPTCEELVYRGLVYKRLRYTSPFWAAACVCDGLFIRRIWHIACESGADALWICAGDDAGICV